MMELPVEYQKLLDGQVQDFIHNYTGDLDKLAFAGSPFMDVSLPLLLQQIEGRDRIKDKLPLWFKTRGILYPPKVNLEQSSSQETATYKANMVEASVLADITGGFGVDSYFLALSASELLYFETNNLLAQIAHHNFITLKVQNIKVFAGEGITCVRDQKPDIIFVDPSRRHDVKGKVFLLEDCLPDLSKEIENLMNIAPSVLVKTSPMLDISIGIKTLKKVTSVHVLAVNNEVKELLFLVNKEQLANLLIRAVNITRKGKQKFDFIYGARTQASIGPPLKYLYEPNAAIMKSGGFVHITDQYPVHKLHQNSHLYSSEQLTSFPGRSFLIREVLEYNKRTINKLKGNIKAHITTRNFPVTTDVLRKKLKMKDGGENYLFFTTGPQDNKLILVCRKVLSSE